MRVCIYIYIYMLHRCTSLENSKRVLAAADGQVSGLITTKSPCGKPSRWKKCTDCTASTGLSETCLSKKGRFVKC